MNLYLNKENCFRILHILYLKMWFLVVTITKIHSMLLTLLKSYIENWDIMMSILCGGIFFPFLLTTMGNIIMATKCVIPERRQIFESNRTCDQLMTKDIF